jgi:hypothetical protein
MTVAATTSPAQRNVIRLSAMKRSLQPVRHATRRTQAAAIVHEFTSPPIKRSPFSIGDAFRSAKDKLKKVVDKVGDGVEKAVDVVGDGLDKVVDGAGKVVDKVEKGVDKVADSVGKFIDSVRTLRLSHWLTLTTSHRPINSTRPSIRISIRSSSTRAFPSSISLSTVRKAACKGVLRSMPISMPM